jgi:hypothetical protein
MTAKNSPADKRSFTFRDVKRGLATDAGIDPIRSGEVGFENSMEAHPDRTSC